MRLPTSPLAPIGALLVLVLLLFASSMSAFLATSHDQTADGNSDGERGAATRFFHRVTVYNVQPGDHVQFNMPWVGGFDPAGPYTKVLVLEGGEGETWLDRPEAAHVLLETEFPRHDPNEDPFSGSYRPGSAFATRTYSPLEARFVRPDIYEGKPHKMGLNGDLHDAIDFLVVYERPAGMAQSTWDSSRDAVRQQADQLSYVVATGFWLDIQPYILTLAGLAGVAFAITAWSWARHHPSVPPSERSSPLEDLMRIQGQAMSYLTMLRNTMRAVGLVLALGGFGLFVTLYVLTLSVEFQPFARRGPWEPVMLLAGLFVYFGSLGLWWVQHRRIARELRRWQASPVPL